MSEGLAPVKDEHEASVSDPFNVPQSSWLNPRSVTAHRDARGVNANRQPSLSEFVSLNSTQNTSVLSLNKATAFPTKSPTSSVEQKNAMASGLTAPQGGELPSNVSASQLSGVNAHTSLSVANADGRSPIVERQTTSFAPNVDMGQAGSGGIHRRSLAHPQRHLSRCNGSGAHNSWAGTHGASHVLHSLAASVNSSSNVVSTNSVYMVRLSGDDGGVEMSFAQPLLQRVSELRGRYKGIDKGQPEEPLCLEQRLVPPISLHIADGVYRFGSQATVPVPWEQFYDDVVAVCECMQHKACQSACLYRLQVLEEKYDMYKLCNSLFEENDAHKRSHCGGGGVFNNSVKVDNGVILQGLVSAPRLVAYIQDTIRTRGEGDIVAVLSEQKIPYSLRMVYELLNFPDLSQLTVDDLGLQPSVVEQVDYPYDPLDPQRNHAGANAAALLRLFLTRDNLNRGAYFAEVVRPYLEKNTERVRCLQGTEVIFYVTGLIPNEWENLAHWLQKQDLLDPYRSCNRYLAALSRKRQGLRNPQERQRGLGVGSDGIFTVDETGMRSSTATLISGDAQQLIAPQPQLAHEHHQQHLDALFLPLFMATIAPEDPRNAAVATLLEHLGGFVIVPDYEECDQSAPPERRRRRPVDVPRSEHVSDMYFAYYVWANLTSLNALRRRRGLNIFQLRSVGVAPSSNRSSATLNNSFVLSYLLCDSIYHGIALEEQPVLQYLYGLHRIGVSMCPLTCTAFAITTFSANPFPIFFRRGLLISLCTFNPLSVHHLDDPLVEEYGMACKLYRLDGVDVSEVALNSVLISSFSDRVKAAWLGEAFITEGWRGNAYELSNVPTVRLMLRHDMWATEREIIFIPARRKSASPVAGIIGRVEKDALRVGPTRDRTSTTDTAVNDTVAAGSLSTGPLASSCPPCGASPRRSLSSSSGIVNVEPATVAVQAPYTVTDPRINFPRVQLIGPYDRDTKYAWIAQSLLRALELRSYYVRSYSDEKITRRDLGYQSTTTTAAAAGGAKEAPRKRHEVVMQQYYTTQNIEQAFRRDHDSFDEDEWMFKTVEGVVVPHEVHQIPRLPQDMCQYDDFRAHVQDLKALTEKHLVGQFAQRRLQLLEHRFRLHRAVNHGLEAGRTAEKVSQNRDFYQSTKVDNAVRTEAGMTARQLLQFIVHKARNSGDDIVWHQAGREPQTLRQLLHELRISPDSLTVDDLNVQLDMNLGGAAAEASDAALYTPEGRDELLTLLLKTDNYLRGRYFAELTKLTFDNLERDRFSFTEYRLTIYGARPDEWALLSSWFDTHGMASSHNRWMIQVPRIYSHLRRSGRVRSFAEYLENIFTPLWLVSLHPSKDPRLFHFLTHLSGFDMVADERRPDLPLNLATRPPHEWTSRDDPPYNYYQYYLWANIYSLNAFRRRRKFSVFSFCPSSGESGPIDHLIGSFLLAHSITYAVQLATDPVLEYLFYLAQIGVIMCPLSNNTKVRPYLQNPFPRFFQRGLRISLGTDCPLQFHHTQEPLLEEYSIASKVWKLSPNDMCEVARNSVLISGFSPAFKQQQLGRLYFLSSSLSNDPSRTHLSGVRVAYRFETYHTEVGYLEYVSGQVLPSKAMLTKQEEDAEIEQLEAAEEQRQQQEQQPSVLLGVGGGIIDAESDAADLSQLQARRALLRARLEDLTRSVHDLQCRNHQLTEKLQEERQRSLFAKHLKLQRKSRPRDTSLDHVEELLEPLTITDGVPHSVQPPHPEVPQLRGEPPPPFASADSSSNIRYDVMPSQTGPGGHNSVPKPSDDDAEQKAAATDVMLPHLLKSATSLVENGNGTRR